MLLFSLVNDFNPHTSIARIAGKMLLKHLFWTGDESGLDEPNAKRSITINETKFTFNYYSFIFDEFFISGARHATAEADFVLLRFTPCCTGTNCWAVYFASLFPSHVGALPLNFLNGFQRNGAIKFRNKSFCSGSTRMSIQFSIIFFFFCLVWLRFQERHTLVRRLLYAFYQIEIQLYIFESTQCTHAHTRVFICRRCARARFQFAAPHIWAETKIVSAFGVPSSSHIVVCARWQEIVSLLCLLMTLRWLLCVRLSSVHPSISISRLCAMCWQCWPHTIKYKICWNKSVKSHIEQIKRGVHAFEAAHALTTPHSRPKRNEWKKKTKQQRAIVLCILCMRAFGHVCSRTR